MSARVAVLIPRAELVLDRVFAGGSVRPLPWDGRYGRYVVTTPQRLANPRVVCRPSQRGEARGLHSVHVLVEVKANFQALALVLTVRGPSELAHRHAAAVAAIKERRARDMIARATRAVACDECGRWGYHLVSCSRGGPR